LLELLSKIAYQNEKGFKLYIFYVYIYFTNSKWSINNTLFFHTKGHGFKTCQRPAENNFCLINFPQIQTGWTLARFG